VEIVSEADDPPFLQITNLRPIKGFPEKLRIGRYMIERVCTEFLSLDWYLQEVVDLMKTRSIDGLAWGTR
jgi:hypothetical protein